MPHEFKSVNFNRPICMIDHFSLIVHAFSFSMLNFNISRQVL